MHSSSRFVSYASLLTAATVALSAPQLRAASYVWLDTGSNNNWLNAANYDSAASGTLAPGAADTFVFNSGSRIVNVNAAGTLGRLEIGTGYTATNINQQNNAVLTLEGGHPDIAEAGISVAAGRTINTNLHARLTLAGDITFSNGGSARLRIGNPDNGAGGLNGSGTLRLRSGVTVLAENVSHTYSGAVTVDAGGTLQVPAPGTFTSYSSLTIGSGGSLAGGGTLAGVTVHSGGRVSPGGEGGITAAPNTLSFTGLLQLQSSGLLTIDVKAAGADAVRATAGGALALGGELQLRLASDYTAAAGTYQILLGLDGASGNFDSVTIRTDAGTTDLTTLTDDGNGLWTGSLASRGYDLSFDAKTGFLNLTAVPEPGPALLSSLGVLLLLRRRKP